MTLSNIIHAYSCRAENNWHYVSICGHVWVVKYFSTPQSVPGQPYKYTPYLNVRVRVSDEPPAITCKLCIRRLRARAACAHRDADVLQPYYAHTTDGRCETPARVRVAS